MQHGQRKLSYQLIAAIASQFLRRYIDRSNQPIRIRCDDAEGSVLKDRVGEFSEMCVLFLCGLRFADIAKRDGQPVSKLDHLTSQPRCLNGVVLHRKLFVQGFSGFNHVAESAEHRSFWPDRRYRAQRPSQHPGTRQTDQSLGIGIHIAKAEVDNLAIAVPYRFEESKGIQARLGRRQKLRMRLLSASSFCRKPILAPECPHRDRRAPKRYQDSSQRSQMNTMIHSLELLKYNPDQERR